ncbi:hypothetical protein PG988_011425 [Apiospora saccharicola]
MVFIRPYQESDFEACAHICRATLPPSLSTTPITAKLAPYIWTHQYTHLSPATCHMLVDDDDSSSPDPSSTPGGKVVGYCIGTPDVYAFADRYPSYTTSILSTAVAPPPPLAPGEEDEPFWIPDDTTLTPSGTAPPLRQETQPGRPDPFGPRPPQAAPARQRSVRSPRPGMAGHYAHRPLARLPAPRLGPPPHRSLRAQRAGERRGPRQGRLDRHRPPDNAGVVQFYDKVGFRLATPLSSEEGDNGADDGIHMVIDIAKSS